MPINEKNPLLKMILFLLNWDNEQTKLFWCYQMIN
jgi:hypothetical protein